MRRLTTAVFLLALCTASSAEGQTSQFTRLDVTLAQSHAAKCSGCGHLYTGEYLKGALLLTVGGAALIYAPFTLTDKCTGEVFSDTCNGSINWTPFVTLLGVAAATYIYGIVDAGPSAKRMNAKHGFQIGSSLQLSPTIAQSANATNIGLKLTRSRKGDVRKRTSGQPAGS